VNWLKRPSTTGGIIYLIVVALLLVGLGVVAIGDWRSGVTLMSVSFGLAFAARAVLPDERAGMLRVRRRLYDLTAMAVCGGTMLVLTFLIRDRR